MMATVMLVSNLVFHQSTVIPITAMSV